MPVTTDSTHTGGQPRRDCLRIMRSVRALGRTHCRVHRGRCRRAACGAGRSRPSCIGAGPVATVLSSMPSAFCGGARQRGRCDPSRLWFPVGECRLCHGLRSSRRAGVHRPARRSHRAHGQQGRGQACYDRRRCALRARLRGRRTSPMRRCWRRAAHRLSGDGQGRGRWRRARHATGRARRRLA